MTQTTRQTKTFSTESCIAVEFYTHINARERYVITKALGSDGTSVNIENAEAGQKAIIETLVVGVNGSSDQIYERLVDLPIADFDAIFAAITEVLSPQKKTS